MPIFLKANHQLESRMREICQSGSEGGARYLASLPLSVIVESYLFQQNLLMTFIPVRLSHK